MITFYLFSFVASTLTPKDIFCGEWDVHVGSLSDHEVAIKYSFEFHLNKTSGRTISTIWRSDLVSTNIPEVQLEPMIAQYELSFQNSKGDSDIFIGTIYYKERSISFTIKSIEKNHLTAKINLDFQNIYVSLDIVNNKTIEISIGSMSNSENEAQFVAIRAQPVKLAQILPMFKEDYLKDITKRNSNKHVQYKLPESGATISDYMKYYYSKGTQLFYQYKIQIYIVLFVIVIQIILFMIINCIQRARSKGKSQQEIDSKLEQSKKKKDDDFQSTPESNESNGNEDDENDEEEESKNQNEEEESGKVLEE